MKYAFPANSRVTPDKLVSGGVTYVDDPNSNDYTTQAMKISATAQTANLVFSKKLAFITPYVGFGFTNTNFNLSMDGNYPTLGDPVTTTTTVNGISLTVPKLNADGKPIMQIKNITNPVSFSSNEVMANATVGLRLKVLMIFTLHAQYTLQKYPVASIGFGVTVR